MKRMFGWLFWGVRTFIASVCASFLAVFVSATFVWFMKNKKGSLDLYEVVSLSANASWRLGSILTVVAIVVIFIAKLRENRK